MRVFVGVISTAIEDANVEVPRVFAGVSGMDCVNKAKQCMVDEMEAMLEASPESAEAFNNAGTGKELAAWFEQHYCYYQYNEYSEELK